MIFKLHLNAFRNRQMLTFENLRTIRGCGDFGIADAEITELGIRGEGGSIRRLWHCTPPPRDCVMAKESCVDNLRSFG